MTEQIIAPEVLQQPARDIIYRLGQLGEQWVTPGIPRFIQDGEHLIWDWDQRDTVTFWRLGQGKDWERDTPLLQLRNIHVPAFSGFFTEEPEPLGAPTSETRVSQAVDLYPGDSTKLSIQDGFTATKTRAEATKEGIEDSAKVRLGSFNTPVGAELLSQITREVTDTDTDAKAHAETLTTEVTVTNNTEEPFRVFLEAERTIQDVRETGMVDCEFDYVIAWVPFQSTVKQHVEGRKEAVWGDLGQFYSSMAGQEPSHVGNISGHYSLSDRAREHHVDPRPPRRIVKMPYTAEYQRTINTRVHQVREPIDTEPVPDTPSWVTRPNEARRFA